MRPAATLRCVRPATALVRGGGRAPGARARNAPAAADGLAFPSFQAPRRPPPRLSRLIVRAGVISSNDFKVGSTIEIDNAPWRVIGEAEGERGKGARRGEE